MPHPRIAISLFSAGAMLSLLSYLFVHQVSSAMKHWEVSAILFNLAYFAGVSYGYFHSEKWSRRRLALWLPLLFAGQALLFFFIRPLFHYFYLWGETAFGRMVRGDTPETFFANTLTWLLLFIVGTPLFAVILPRAIQEHSLTLRKAYTLEIAGSLCGLLLVLLMVFGRFEVLVACYSLFAVALAWSLGLPRASVGVMAALALVWVAAFDRVDKATALWYYQVRYPKLGPMEVVDTRYTPYHKIEMVQLTGNDKLLVLNGRRQFAGGSHHVYSYFVSEVPARMLKTPRVLVLGCGSMSSVGRIGDLASTIKIVDIDPQVFATSKQYYPQYNRLAELKNWTFVADDAKHFLANDTEKYDLILHDIPPASSRQIALTYTQEFFDLAKARLSDHGIFSISALRSNFKDVNYGRKILKTLTSVFPEVNALVYGDSFYTYSGFDLKRPEIKAVLEAPQRSLAQDEKKQWFHESATYWNQDAIEKETTDLSPVTIANLGDLVFD